MKITEIKIFPVRVGGGSQLLVKVETDTDHYGWGASGLSTRELAVAGALQHFSGFLVGRDPRKIGAIWQELYRSQYFEGGRVLTAAISAVDIALHDLKAKALGVPVCDLLGGRQRDQVECFASLPFRDTAQLIERANRLLALGWNVLRVTHYDDRATGGAARTFSPRESIHEVADSLVALRREVGPAPTIGYDFHHRLTVPETVSFADRMPAGTLDFLEEPIRCETPEAYESLRRMVRIPFAIGEEFSSKWQFRPYLERGITQFARLDVCNVGGLTESTKVAAMAEAHYIDLMPHNPVGPICTAASVHLAAASPNFAWLEETCTPVNDQGICPPDLYPVQPKLKGSRYEVPTVPGLGIEVDEAYATETTFEPREAPHWVRPDGSVTNW
jgi:galactonate dehydratase